MSWRLEPAIWSRNTGSADTLFWQVSIAHNMDVQYQRGRRSTKAACPHYLEYGRHVARLRRRRRAYAPTSNTAAHDSHEKISSWVSFSLYGYGAPLWTMIWVLPAYKSLTETNVKRVTFVCWSLKVNFHECFLHVNVFFKTCRNILFLMA